MVTDKSGRFYEQIEYFPYGETWINDRSTNENLPYKFTSKELDTETGLYYYGARYYDCKLSRWISADPPLATGEYFPSGGNNSNLPGMGGVFNSINLNGYTYCAENPVIYMDPDGKKPKTYKAHKDMYYFSPDRFTWGQASETVVSGIIPFFGDAITWGINRGFGFKSIKPKDAQNGLNLLKKEGLKVSLDLLSYADDIGELAKLSGNALKASKLLGFIGTVVNIGITACSAIDDLQQQENIAADNFISNQLGPYLVANSHENVSILYYYALGRMQQLKEKGLVKYDVNNDGTIGGMWMDKDAGAQLKSELTELRKTMNAEIDDM
ncbi:MAG: RHS repeat-associated core domain-containing protein [Spirochaetes bacterium]|nr:RHS repeat-associated core domain-containing protein [Spirochaetota bacterium]